MRSPHLESRAGRGGGGARSRVRSGRDVWVLARAVVALRALEGSLRRRGFAATHERARLAVETGTRRNVPADLDQAEHLGTLVALAARIARVRCLPRALLLYTWLGRNGAPVRLCIGVRREGRALRAHAWTEWTTQSGEALPLGEASPVRRDFAVLRGGFSSEGNELEASDFVGA